MMKMKMMMISLILLSNSAASLKIVSESQGKRGEDKPDVRTKEETSSPPSLANVDIGDGDESKGNFEPFCFDITSEKMGFKILNGLCSGCMSKFDECLWSNGAYMDYWHYDFKVNATTKIEKPMLAAQRRNQRLQFMRNSLEYDPTEQYKPCFKKLIKCAEKMDPTVLVSLGLVDMETFELDPKKAERKMERMEEKGVTLGHCMDMTDAFYIWEEMKYGKKEKEVTKCKPSWKWKKLQWWITCGECTGLIKIQKFDPPSCKTYCESFGHTCVKAADDYHSTCMEAHEEPCDWAFPEDETKFALCTCKRS